MNARDLPPELLGPRRCRTIFDGDWVESMSALVENADGRLELVYWGHCLPACAAATVAETSALAA